MPGKYVEKRRGKGYVQKTDTFGNVHTFSKEEYKGSHGHRVVGPDGRTTYDRPQGMFRSRQLARATENRKPVGARSSFFRERSASQAAENAGSWGSRGGLSPFPEEAETKKLRKRTW